MKIVQRIATLLLFVGTLTTACLSHIDRLTADKLAQAALEKYCKDEGLTLSQFSTAEVVDDGNLWAYNYRYEGHPRQLVTVLVYRQGGTEVQRMIEEKSAP